jgi:multiple RNA-binding domain-containing protein 1
LFGFVGFASRDEAVQAVSHFNGTFVDTSKIGVEMAKGVHDASLARPWSKYSEGSSRFVGKDKDVKGSDVKKRAREQERVASDQLERERDEKFAQFLKLAMPGKSASSSEKRSMPWENVEEEENEAKSKQDAPEEMDDLAWLRAKQGLEPEDEKDKKKKKKKKEEEQQEV